MISEADLRNISEVVGPAHLITRTNDLEAYGSDATKLVYAPDAAAFPGTADEVSKILQLATREGFPVIPRGAGSGMSGGALPVRGGLVLAMDRFDRILSIDPDNLVAKVETGVITGRLQAAAEELGLFYPPDPASSDISTIGGNVAECAGGLRAVKYGVTRDYVLGLTMVIPTGEILKVGVETAKGVAGYDLTRLVIGSEGTLAVITDITLRLLPKPETNRTMIAFFPDVSSAVRIVSRIIANRIIPTVLELMDRICVDAVKDEIEFPIPPRTGALLLMEVDGDEAAVARSADMIRRVCEEGRALGFESASGGEAVDRLWEARRKLSPSLYKCRPHKISEDVVVPRTRMPELVSHLEALSRRYGLPIPAFGHAGDGNIHVNIMLDKSDPEELEKAHDVVEKVFEKVLALGGTITGEHGIGITKAPYLEMEIPRAGLELMQRIKKAFDPKGILNPGKIFDGSGSKEWI
ncbi:MAG: FAD-binding protein [Deltaproteobacteria bacterium]|nr:FAD-binding protein [Deltaproteobacteria bacterium]MBW2285863.1 FAD-binding protein [Deltaproteobacteria bacterium]